MPTDLIQYILDYMNRYVVNLPRKQAFVGYSERHDFWGKYSLIKDHRVHIVRKSQENYVLENTRKNQERTGNVIENWRKSRKSLKIFIILVNDFFVVH